jgi:hypothetical protein
MNTLYLDFLATHLSLFSGVKDPLEADDWLRTNESKFGLLHRIRRLCTLLNSSEAQQEPSGHHTPLDYQLITKYNGVSSASPSVATIYRRALCTISCQSSSICNRGTAPSTSTSRSSTTSRSMGHIMLILTRRSSSSARGSPYNYRTV